MRPACDEQRLNARPAIEPCCTATNDSAGPPAIGGYRGQRLPSRPIAHLPSRPERARLRDEPTGEGRLSRDLQGVVVGIPILSSNVALPKGHSLA